MESSVERPASLRQRAVHGAVWSFVSLAGRRAAALITMVILARLLSPSDFGLVAMAMVFVGMIELIRDVGTGAGIVQAPSVDDTLLSSLFWLNVALGVTAAVVLVMAAPAIAAIFGEPRLTRIVRLLALSPLLSSFGVVHTNLLLRELSFRRLAIAEVGGATAGGAAGIGFALAGHGASSLVIQTTLTALLISAGTWFASGWRPRLTFQLQRVRVIARFSANLTAFNALNFVARNADNFLIGRYLGAQSLGLYDLAYRVMLSSVQFLSGAATRALFPVYARFSNDDRRFATAYFRVMRVTALIAFPLLFGLMGVADPLVEIVFGPAWTPAIPLILILSPVGALQAIGTTVGNIYQAKGRTDLMMRWAAVAGLLIVGGFIVGLQWGVTGVAVTYAIVCGALTYHLFKIPLQLIDAHPRQVFTAVSRPLYCSLVMLFVVMLVDATLPNDFATGTRLGVLVTTGAVVYAVSTWLVNREVVTQLVSLADPRATQA